MKYRVVERVVFEYVYEVEAESKAEAARIINDIGDGEAESHDEISRNVRRVEELE